MRHDSLYNAKNFFIVSCACFFVSAIMIHTFLINQKLNFPHLVPNWIFLIFAVVFIAFGFYTRHIAKIRREIESKKQNDLFKE